ncbi:MAG: methyltransferase domain-containing protein [Coriobacteriales bacterium]|jgi:ubiquinone/menaquinone biosynthesis C-methylase UbiE|nr:methyltransferase domain-containing protein [Coriobacteriales bacterium]
MDNHLKIDWAEAWRVHHAGRKTPGDSDYWNGRAKQFSTHAGMSPYARKFIAKLGLKGGETIFDMGAGGGTLAIPLAQMGHTVVAADFSSGMLNTLAAAADALELTTISTLRLSWEDDWFNGSFLIDPTGKLPKGPLREKQFDVAIASRSTIVADLEDAFAKLTRIAKRKVAVTMATEFSPKRFDALKVAIGQHPNEHDDFIYGLGLLLQQGKYPTLSYIDSRKTDAFVSRAAAIDYYTQLVGEMTPEQTARLAAYLDEHLIFEASTESPEKSSADVRFMPWVHPEVSVENPEQGPNNSDHDRAGDNKHTHEQDHTHERYMLDTQRLVRWAFITWNPGID